MPFDRDGKIAAGGKPLDGIVATLLKDPYFRMEPPKSTGRELFSSAYVEKLIADCRAQDATDADTIATAVELTARSVADAYKRFMPEPVREVLISGGGAKNPVLFASIAKLLAPLEVRQFDESFFDGEAKEAVAFALLGYLHLMGIPGNVSTATGAKGPRLLGKLTPA